MTEIMLVLFSRGKKEKERARDINEGPSGVAPLISLLASAHVLFDPVSCCDASLVRMILSRIYRQA